MTEHLYKTGLESFTRFPKYNYIGVDACGCLAIFRHKPKLIKIKGTKDFTLNYVWVLSFWGFICQAFSSDKYRESLPLDFCIRTSHDEMYSMYSKQDANLLERKWYKRHKML
jgi:hypothetical protein